MALRRSSNGPAEQSSVLKAPNSLPAWGSSNSSWVAACLSLAPYTVQPYLAQLEAGAAGPSASGNGVRRAMAMLPGSWSPAIGPPWCGMDRACVKIAISAAITFGGTPSSFLSSFAVSNEQCSQSPSDIVVQSRKRSWCIASFDVLRSIFHRAGPCTFGQAPRHAQRLSPVIDHVNPGQAVHSQHGPPDVTAWKCTSTRVRYPPGSPAIAHRH